MRFRSSLAVVIGLAAVPAGLAACGGGRGTGPAWPDSAGSMVGEPEDDGGESLEPDVPAEVAALESTGADEATEVEAEVETVAAAAPAEAPAAASEEAPVEAVPDEILLEEEIIIEIE